MNGKVFGGVSLMVAVNLFGCVGCGLGDWVTAEDEDTVCSILEDGFLRPQKFDARHSRSEITKGVQKLVDDYILEIDEFSKSYRKECDALRSDLQQDASSRNKLAYLGELSVPLRWNHKITTVGHSCSSGDYCCYIYDSVYANESEKVDLAKDSGNEELLKYAEEKRNQNPKSFSGCG